MKDVKVVIGANFGDEGKGLMTDYFADDAGKKKMTCLVVCSNGGAQRGHTVKVRADKSKGNVGEVRHVFHHFGSGTFAGADTYLPHFFILNPIVFMNEYRELTRQIGRASGGRLDCMPKVYIHPECFVSTPYDMILNQILEESRGNARHGSCGMGIWETLVRQGKSFAEMAGMSDDEIIDYLRDDCRTYMWKRLKEKGVSEIRNEWNEILDDFGLILNYIDDFRRMQEICKPADVEIFDEYDRVIFENGQGLLLDRCRREYGHNTTPSNTGLRNPAALLREFDKWKNGSYVNVQAGVAAVEGEMVDVEVCYVTRTYLTRHGAGRFDEECDKAEINPDMVDLTNIPNPHQGTMRYGKLDGGAVERRIGEDFDSERLPCMYEARRTLAVTHVNEFGHIIIDQADYLSDGEDRESVIDGTYYQCHNKTNFIYGEAV